jgi:hypothetical protein
MTKQKVKQELKKIHPDAELIDQIGGGVTILAPPMHSWTSFHEDCSVCEYHDDEWDSKSEYWQHVIETIRQLKDELISCVPECSVEGGGCCEFWEAE